jgi:putative transposase
MALYHVLNRGVEKRNLFMDNGDRARFVHDLWEFNDVHNAQNVTRHSASMTGLRNPSSMREPIVDLHGWCLMDNHYHLLVSEVAAGGLTKFIRRLNVGYANYFNERYKRRGTLFQGRTKKIPILSDSHFLHILHYIHLNPLDTLTGAKDWRNLEIHNVHTALEHLEKYRWSSYLDYCGMQNFPSILTTHLFKDVFGNYEKVIKRYIKDLNEIPFETKYLE